MRNVKPDRTGVHSGRPGYLENRTPEEIKVRTGQRDLVLRVCRGVRFSGRLVDGEGRPVACTLERWQPNGNGRTGSGGHTDSEGRFSWSSVRPGPIRLVAIVSGIKRDLGEFTAPADDVVITID